MAKKKTAGKKRRQRAGGRVQPVIIDGYTHTAYRPGDVIQCKVGVSNLPSVQMIHIADRNIHLHVSGHRLPHIPYGLADLVFCDPPYNLGVAYDGCTAEDDTMTPDDYRRWCRWMLGAAFTAVRPGGAVWVLINEANADMIGGMMTSMIGPRVNRVIWREAFGQYRECPMASGHRHLFYHVRGTAGDGPSVPAYTWNPDPIRIPSARQEVYGDKRAGGNRPENKRGRVPDDVWDVSRLCGTFKERVDWHPAQLPQAPLETIIKATTNFGDSVVEICSGSGSLACVCAKHGRNYTGFDTSLMYCVKAAQRVEHVMSGGV